MELYNGTYQHAQRSIHPASEESPPNTLLKRHMDFKYFVKGLRESERLKRCPAGEMFLDMCESIHPRDAEVIVTMINKKPPMKVSLRHW